MISYELDPSLHAREPRPELLDDGFSPRHHGDTPDSTLPPVPELEPVLSEKSLF